MSPVRLLGLQIAIMAATDDGENLAVLPLPPFSINAADLDQVADRVRDILATVDPS